MRRNQTKNMVLAIALGLALTGSVVAQDNGTKIGQASSSAKDEGRKVARATSGQKQKIKGTIIKRDPDGFVMRDLNGNDWSVSLTNSTEVKERKSNIFRGAQKYGVTRYCAA